MLFNSYIFIFLFFPAVLITYFGLNRIRQYELSKIALILFSFIFYGYMNYSYVLILLASVTVNYLCSYGLKKWEQNVFLKKCTGFFAIIFNLGLLFYYKYYDFFIENINNIFKQDFVLKHIALPLGISFFTFQQISYIADRIQNKVSHYRLVDYTLFVSYFPQLIAGPIVRHGELIPQFQNNELKSFHSANFLKGVRIFSLGLGKKILVADELGKVVNAGFSSINSLDTPIAAVTMLFYTFQIFFDFSAYSDMAIGIGKMMNIDLPRNFDQPYLSASVKEFWKRWHITPNSFFTEYVYYPLGGSRCSKIINLRNIMTVFLLSGIWHGANWTFVVWGIVNGLAICLESLISYEKLNRAVRICNLPILRG